MNKREYLTEVYFQGHFLFGTRDKFCVLEQYLSDLASESDILIPDCSCTEGCIKDGYALFPDECTYKDLLEKRGDFPLTTREQLLLSSIYRVIRNSC